MLSRSATRTTLVVILAGIVVLGVVGIATSTPIGPGTGCVQNAYGEQCVAVNASSQVTGIGAQLTWDAYQLNDLPWTFVTTTYSCDPRGNTKQQCAPLHTVYGTTQPAAPHRTAAQDCSTAGDVASYGDCRGTFNVPLPATFANARWLCEEYAVRVQGKWVTNGTGIPEGTRACRAIN